MTGFKSTLDTISKKKWGPILGIIIAFIVGYLLLVYIPSSVCFGTLLVALVAFFIPYYFGLKKFKWLAVWGIIFILLMPIPFAATQVNIAYDYEEKGYTASSDDKTLVSGGVDPYTLSEDKSYTFYVEADPRYEGVELHLLNAYTDTKPTTYQMNKTDTISEDGKILYTYQFKDLKTGYYTFNFEGVYKDGSEISTQHTGALIGPINDTKDSFFLHMLESSYLNIALFVGLLYFLLMFMVYTNRKNREAFEKQRANQTQPQMGSDGMFHCPKCNTEVIKGQKFCPQCGENFAVDTREVHVPAAPFKGADDDYFCTECGTKVDENATVCPGCGKKFE